MEANKIPPSQSTGNDGLLGRSDLAELNLAHYPSVQVALGNMNDTTDAELMQTPNGRQQYAEAVAAGVTAYLATQPK
jgi:N-acetylmuramoyl-L-alanine amidase